jgi:hypothetical protein
MTGHHSGRGDEPTSTRDGLIRDFKHLAKSARTRIWNSFAAYYSSCPYSLPSLSLEREIETLPQIYTTRTLLSVNSNGLYVCIPWIYFT